MLVLSSQLMNNIIKQLESFKLALYYILRLSVACINHVYTISTQELQELLKTKYTFIQ